MMGRYYESWARRSSLPPARGRDTTGSGRFPRQRRIVERWRLSSHLVAISLLGVALGLGVLWAVGELKHGQWMPVRTVAVRGVAAERAEEIRAYAGVPAGAPLFGIDLDEVARRVREHPFVAGATVRRVPPEGIEIDVNERVPVAVLSAGGLYLVDERGVPFKRADPHDGVDLPVVTGISREALLDDRGRRDLDIALMAIVEYARAGEPAGALSEVHLEKHRGASLVFPGGLRVEVGSTGFAQKYAQLRRVLDELARREAQASFIYLNDDRRPERVAVRLRASAEMLARFGT